jgi:hypothetical protein
MNIWALDKDESIKVLLLLLSEKIGTDNLVLSNRQDVNARAVRLAKNDDPLISAYLYTYGQDDGKCGIHLEFPQHAESDISSSMDVYENVGIDALVDMLSVHFDLTP